MARSLFGFFTLGLLATAVGASPPEGMHLLRLHDLDLFQREAIRSQSLDIWENDLSTALVYVTSEQRHWIEAEGIAHQDERALLEAQFRTKDVDGFFTLAEYEAAMQGWVNARPEIVSLSSLGKTIENRDVWMLTLGDNAGTDEGEPEVFIIALQHCREWLAGMTVYGIVDHLVNEYGSDTLVTSLMDDLEIHVVLVANPDGYVYTHTNDRLWRKNRRNNGDGTFGVDLNRNFPVAWDSSQPSSSTTYGGPFPLSEPETHAVTNFLESPERRLVGLLNYHTYGTRVMHSYAYSYAMPPNGDVMGDAAYDMAQAIESVNGQRMRNGRWSVALEYLGGGATVDYAQERIGVPAFTLELRPGDGASGGFVPAGTSIAPSQSENIAGALNYLQWVRNAGLDDTPPEIANLAVTRVSNNEATLRWTTDDLSSRAVEYGLDESLGTAFQPDKMPALSNSVTLTGLSPGTSYHARAVARNTAGLESASETLTFTTAAAAQDFTPPSAPAPYWIVRLNDSQIRMRWLNLGGADVVGARLYISSDRVNYTLHVGEDVLLPGVSPINLPAPPAEELVFFRLVAIDAAGNESAPGDIYPYRHGAVSNDLLIVDGYDQWNGRPVATSLGNHTFASDFGVAVNARGVSFDVTTNNGVTEDLDLGDYRTVLWMLGDESTGSETFSADEQAIVRAFLEGGGNLFVSGSEVGYDLDRSGGPTTADRAFYNNYLGADYSGDDTDNYETVGTGGASLFGAMRIPFDEGSQRIYRVSTPDWFVPAGGSTLALQTLNGRGIGVQRTGLYGSGTVSGRVVYIGFPFETIFPETKRVDVMDAVLEYFGVRGGTGPEDWTIF